MCVWNEEDIIESTIKHLFAQGCANVFIVDNNSTDRTVAVALNAGAKLAGSFESKYFNEDLKIAHLNATVKFINKNTAEDRIWWLYVDADEFPNIEGGTIAHHLNLLGSEIRAIHGYLFDHLPAHSPHHVQGYHPIDFQPVCVKTATSKIPLLRYDKGKKHLFSIGGAHDFITHRESIPTLMDILQIHHFPYRNIDATLLRLKKLIDRNNSGLKDIDWEKERQLNHISKPIISGYQSRYDSLHSTYNNKNLCLKTKSLLYDFKNITRWYDVNADKEFNSSDYEKQIHLAVYYFFMREYDIALCSFKDAFDICNNNETMPWLLLKMAECFSYADIDAAQNIVADLKKLNNSEIMDYIDESFDYIIKNNDAKNIICKVEFSKSIFPDGNEERYNKLMQEIEKNIHPHLYNYI